MTVVPLQKLFIQIWSLHNAVARLAILGRIVRTHSLSFGRTQPMDEGLKRAFILLLRNIYNSSGSAVSVVLCSIRPYWGSGHASVSVAVRHHAVEYKDQNSAAEAPTPRHDPF